MADPFEALREPVEPIEPDPLFAAHLRARVARALTLPRGVTVSQLALDPEPTAVAPAASAESRPAGEAGDVAYASLWVPDGARAAAFFRAVLGWRYRPGGGGRASQVEGQSLPHGIFGGQERSTLFLSFAVDDLPEALEQVRAAGGQAGAPRRERYGRAADCADDQGVPFALVELPAAARGGPRGPVNGAYHGDIAYLTMEVVDSARARAFYGSVLGWQFSAGRVQDGWNATDVVPMLGLHGGHNRATVLPMYRVDDIGAAVARVRAHGGTSMGPDQQPYGVTADCADDQGTRFSLGQF